MPEIYITYGCSNRFDRNKFMPIKNTNYSWVKPAQGGLWASPVNAVNSWYNWCLSNNYRLNRLDTFFKFKVKDDSKIISISSKDDLVDLYSAGFCIDRFSKDEYRVRDDMYYLDFEKMLEYGYDAIKVIMTKDTYWALSCWDCDTLLVLNPDCIVTVNS